MKHRKKRYQLVITIAIVIIILCQIHYRTQVWAIFNPDTAIHIDAASIDNATMIIGTHLIYLGSLNDSIYEAAMRSAQESGQQSIFYKSELADGGWFDITDAGSLEDIMASGTRVENELINALSVTHHTKADGITYDLRKMQTVNIFDIYDIYDLESMPELEPLKLRYDRMKEEKGEEIDEEKINFYKQNISNFFRTTLTKEEEEEEAALHIRREEITRVHTDETKQYDEQMQALQGYYEILKNNNGTAEETDTVLKVMNKLDAAKKAVIFPIIGESLERLGTRIQEKYEVDESLLTAIEESKVNIADGQMEYEQNRLSAGMTVMSGMEYELELELIAKALSGQHSECDAAVARLNGLYHIMNGQIVQKPEELELASELIAKMDQVYAQSLQEGIDDVYDKAAAGHSSHVILDNIISSHTVTWNVLRSELQFYVQAKVDRLDNKKAQEFVKDRISHSGQFRGVIPQDAFQSSAAGTVETYVIWLQKLFGSLSGEGSASELDKLYEEKLALQEEKMTALDKEDIRGAKKAEAKLQAKAEEINKLESAAASDLEFLEAQKKTLEAKLAIQTDDQKAKEDVADQLARIQQQIAEGSTELSDGSTAQNIQDMKQDAIRLIKEGDTSGNKLEELSGCIEGIGTFLESGSTLALNAQKSIYNEMLTSSYLREQTDYDTLIAGIEEQIENNMGNNIGNQTGDKLAADSVLNVLEDTLGGPLTIRKAESTDASISGGNTDGEGKTDDAQAAVIALTNYAERTGDEEIRSLAAGIAISMMKEGDASTFEQINSVNGSFAAAPALAEYLHYRYLWNENKKTAIVANGLSYYSFTAFHNRVEKNDGESYDMSVAAEFRKTVYIPSEYIYREFGCRVFNITGTKYAILVDDDIIEKADYLMAVLLEKEGGS